MTTNDMVSLRAIADELGVNYYTLLSCKKRFDQYIYGVQIGRAIRYPSTLNDFFLMVFTLYDEGYTTEGIVELLKHGAKSNDSQTVKNWAERWRNNIFSYSFNVKDNGNLAFQNVRNQSPCERVSEGVSEGVREGVSEGVREGHGDKPAQNRHSPAGQNGRKGAAISNRDSGLEKLREELIRINAELVVGLGREVENVMASMTADINMALTQYYRSITALMDVVENLANQVGGEGKALVSKIPELDLTKCQVAAPSLQWNPPSAEEIRDRQGQASDADINLVVESIKHGRPDKDVVIEWLKAQKAIKPDIAYSTLADMLNAAGVPTLRGLEKWSRGVVRSLISEEE